MVNPIPQYFRLSRSRDHQSNQRWPAVASEVHRSRGPRTSLAACSSSDRCHPCRDVAQWRYPFMLQRSRQKHGKIHGKILRSCSLADLKQRNMWISLKCQSSVHSTPKSLHGQPRSFCTTHTDFRKAVDTKQLVTH